jgi:hypothetical protein
MSDETKTTTEKPFDFKGAKVKTLSGLLNGPEFSGTVEMKFDDFAKIGATNKVACLFVKTEEFTSKGPKGKGSGSGSKGGRKAGEKVQAVRFVCAIEGMKERFNVFTSGKAFVDLLTKNKDAVPFVFQVAKAGQGMKQYFRPV